MTDFMPKNTIFDIIRAFLSLLDMVAYGIMELLYSIFFTVTTADLLGGEMIKNIYYRVQLILGVFMIFKLAVTILQGIMNPDLVYDKKQGMGKIITRIVVSLIMLAVISPINVPNPSNEWEQQLSNNGLLFGSLFSLQNRILSNNTIGRLILGTTDTTTDPTSPNNLKETSRTFSSTILKTFVRINVLPTLQENPEDGRDPATITANRVCKNINDEDLKTYISSNASPQEILSLVNSGCSQVGTLGKEYYAFYYLPLVSTIVAIIIDFVLIAYTVDVAIRVFKLAILRLIAPIPIISHMSIDASKEAKGADSFSLWTKALISTYIEIFIRLAIIYFVLFVVQGLMAKGVMGLFLGFRANGTFFLNSIAFVFIIIGLMLFAKQAPKYIQSVLGIQSSGGSVGLTAFATIAGSIRGGTKLSDIKTLRDNVSETVAEKNFGDKSKGHGQFYNSKKATIDKIFSDYGRDLQQEYYKRGLDIGTQDNTGFKKGWWQDAKYAKAQAPYDSLKENQQRYNKEAVHYQAARGRGNAVRVAQVPTTPPTTSPTSEPVSTPKAATTTTPPTTSPTSGPPTT